MINKCRLVGKSTKRTQADKSKALRSSIPDENNKTKPRREFGAARALIWMSTDFDQPDEALIKLFGG